MECLFVLQQLEKLPIRIPHVSLADGKFESEVLEV